MSEPVSPIRPKDLRISDEQIRRAVSLLAEITRDAVPDPKAPATPMESGAGLELPSARHTILLAQRSFTASLRLLQIEERDD
jgi:hypothetical protein